MSNWFETPQIISPYMVAEVYNKLVLAKLVFRKHSDQFKEVGDNIDIDLPVDFQVADGADITSTIQDIKQRKINLRLTYRKNVAYAVTSQEKTLDIRGAMAQFGKPAAEQLANFIDRTIATEMYQRAWFYTGTAGTTPFSSDLSALRGVMALQNKLAVEDEGRNLVMDANAHAYLINTLHNKYVTSVSGPAIKRAYVDTIFGYRCFHNNNIRTHAASGAQTTVTVTTALSNASTNKDRITVGGLDADLAVGDTFKIAGVYAVNPRSKDTTDELQCFTVKTALSYTGSGDVIQFSPTICMSDETGTQTGPQYQNVSAYPAAAAALTFDIDATASVNNLAFTKNAFALAMVPLAPLEGGVNVARSSHKGITIRVMTGSDIKTDEQIVRFDVLFGVQMLDGRRVCRLLG